VKGRAATGELEINLIFGKRKARESLDREGEGAI
jgi:hypothetical protein